MTAKRLLLRELAYSPASCQVDRDAGIIRHVKVIGLSSENGRCYPAEVLQAACSLYEGVKVNIDHPTKSGEQRAASDRFGRLVNCVFKGDGIYADLEFLKSHPLAERVCEAAERMPGAYGLSHNADGQTEFKNGQTVVVKIFGVESVDLVADPATTRGLFENKQTRLVEMDDEVQAPSADEQIAASFKSAGYAIVDAIMAGELDGPAGVSKLKDLLKAHAKLSDEPEAPAATTEGDDEEKSEEPVAEAEGDEEKKDEEKKEESALTYIRNLTESLGRVPTATELKALRGLTESEQKEIIGGLKVKAAPRTKAAANVEINSPLWTDRKAFLESIRN